MGAVLHRITKEYRTSVNTPDFADPPWLIDPNVKALQDAGVPTRYWKINPDNSVVEMTPAEKTAADQAVQTVFLQPSAAAEDGVPTVRANGVDKHTITVKKRDLSNNDVPFGAETVRVVPDVPVPISNSLPALASGVATITVGPTKQVGEVRLSALDPAGVLRPTAVPTALRFRSPEGKPEAPLPLGQVVGARLTAVNAVSVTVGEAGKRSFVRDNGNLFDIEFTGELTANITLSGAGGLQPGLVEANNTWYAVLVIGDTTGANPPAAMFTDAANAGAPTLPAGYDVFRRVAWVRNNGTGNFLRTIQSGNARSRRYHYNEPFANLVILTGGNSTVAALVNLASLVPPTSRNVLLILSFVTNVAGDRARIRPAGSTSAAYVLRPGFISTAGATGVADIVTNNIQAIEYIVDNALDSLDIAVIGFLDEI